MPGPVEKTDHSTQMTPAKETKFPTGESNLREYNDNHNDHGRNKSLLRHAHETTTSHDFYYHDDDELNFDHEADVSIIRENDQSTMDRDTTPKLDLTLKKFRQQRTNQDASFALGESAGWDSQGQQGQPHYQNVEIEDHHPIGNVEDLMASWLNNLCQIVSIFLLFQNPTGEEGILYRAHDEENCETINRFKQLGVSFLKKDDLIVQDANRGSGQGGNPSQNCEPSLWHPTAEDPFQNQHQYSTNAPKDYSTMFNTFAHKYQLEVLDRNSTSTSSLSRDSDHTRLEPANVTKYGLPESEMSATTRNLLDNTKYMTRPQ